MNAMLDSEYLWDGQSHNLLMPALALAWAPGRTSSWTHWPEWSRINSVTWSVWDAFGICRFQTYVIYDKSLLIIKAPHQQCSARQAVHRRTRECLQRGELRTWDVRHWTWSTTLSPGFIFAWTALTSHRIDIIDIIYQENRFQDHSHLCLDSNVNHDHCCLVVLHHHDRNWPVSKAGLLQALNDDRLCVRTSGKDSLSISIS